MTLFLIIFLSLALSTQLNAGTKIPEEKIPSLEITNSEKVFSEKDPTDVLELKEEKFKINDDSLKRFSSTPKIKDSHNYLEKNNLGSLSQNEKTIEGIDLSATSSPILRFILEEIRPLIETRIDSMLVKSGFDSSIREHTKIESQLKIDTIRANTNPEAMSAACGQKVEVSFDVEDEYNSPINDDYSQKKTWIQIGQNYLPKGLELGLLGMKIGETRKIFSPHNLNSGRSNWSSKLFLTKKPLFFRVTMHDIKDDESLDKIKNNLRFYDVTSSISRELICTDHVQVSLRILNSSGQLLYSTPSQFKFIIGSGLSPYLEELLIGAKSSGKRLAFVESKYLQELKVVPMLKGIEKVLDSNPAVILEISPKLI